MKSKIYIVGAGISGLIAAKTLKEKGFGPIILDADNRIGGRVKTDERHGAYFDHGFQVLLTAYPQVQKHLDLSSLNLRYFKPGALLFDYGKRQRIGDPLRDISSLWPTLVSSAGSLGDKIRIFRLSRKLKGKSIDRIFKEDERTTFAYLKAYGFSDKIIRSFFRPFFTGIFLEDELKTSSRMFEFVFKMFSEGYAALPKKGIGAVAEQLTAQWKLTTFELDKRVAKVENGKVILDNKTTLPCDGVIMTAPMNDGGETNVGIEWHGCHNLYFETEKHAFATGIIGLISSGETLANNLHYLFDSKTPILSVTVVKKHRLSVEELAHHVSKELKKHCGITTLKLLGHYHIAKALPDISDITTHPATAAANGSIFMAGDHTLNGSLNAAMASGEAAAERLAEYLERER